MDRKGRSHLRAWAGTPTHRGFPKATLALVIIQCEIVTVQHLNHLLISIESVPPPEKCPPSKTQASVRRLMAEVVSDIPHPAAAVDVYIISVRTTDASTSYAGQKLSGSTVHGRAGATLAD